MSENDSTRETMADVSHTNPVTGETAGRLFSRGPTVATDGGEEPSSGKPAATDSNGRTDEKPTETMADVEHTPPNNSDDANRVFERGQEPTETAEDEE